MYYYEIFSPVARMTTICTLIVVASVRQWHISQLNVKKILLERISSRRSLYGAASLFSHDYEYVASLKKHYMVPNKHLLFGLRNFML